MIASINPSKGRSSSLDCIWQGQPPYPSPFALLFEVEKHVGADWSEHREYVRVVRDQSAEAWAKGTFAALIVINRIRITNRTDDSRWDL